MSSPRPFAKGDKDDAPGCIAATWSKIWPVGLIVIYMTFVLMSLAAMIQLETDLSKYNGLEAVHRNTGLRGVILRGHANERIDVRIYDEVRGFYTETFWISEL